jgi:hypothetical protein
MSNPSRIQLSESRTAKGFETGNGIKDIGLWGSKLGLLCGEPFRFAVINPSSGAV